MVHDSMVEQIVRSLSFDVEAVPQDSTIEVTTTSKSAPLNVKIRVRKKEQAGFQHGVLSLPKPDQPDHIPERIELVSSDQTIMSFNVVVEADFEQTKRKRRKNILGMFKPTICMGAQPDEDEYAYLPSTTYKAEKYEKCTSQSEGALTKFTVTKTDDNLETSTTLPKRKKDIFGKCKPGGCLDPPFGEDRYPYAPIVSERKTNSKNVIKVTERTAGQTAENKSRTSSIFSNKLFNWKRKSYNDEALDNNVINTETKAESVLDLYQAASLQTSTTYSNSIITYPPTLNSSELRIQEEKLRGGRIYNDTSKNPVNLHSGSYFIIPKNKKNVLDKNNTVKLTDRSSIVDVEIGTVKTTSDPKNKNNNGIHQDLEYKDMKLNLRTKDFITDAEGAGAEGYLIESTDSKKGHTFKTDSEDISRPEKEDGGVSSRTLINNIVPHIIHIPLLIKTDHTDPKINNAIEVSTNYTPVTMLILDKAADREIPEHVKSISPKNTNIPILTETESIESQNISPKKDKGPNKTQNNKLELLEASSPVSKLILDKVADTELINMRAPTFIKDKNVIENDNSINKIYVPEDIEESVNKSSIQNQTNNTYQYSINDEIANKLTPRTIDISNSSTELKEIDDFIYSHDVKFDTLSKTELKEQTEMSKHSLIKEINDFANLAAKFPGNNRSPLDQKLIETNHKESIKPTSSVSKIVMEIRKSVDSKSSSTKTDNLQVSEKNMLNRDVTEQDFILLAIQTDNQKTISANDHAFNTYKEVEHILSSQNVDDSKHGDKSAVILDAEREMSVYDLIALDTKPTLREENKISSQDLRDDDSTDISTPVKTESPLEIFQIEGNDLQQLWKNKTNPLESDTTFYTKNEFYKQTDSYDKDIDTINEVRENETVAESSNIQILSIFKQEKYNIQNDLVGAKVRKLISDEYDTDIQNAQPKFENIDHNALLGDNIRTTLGKNYETDNFASQKSGDISFVRQSSITLIMSESNDALDLPVSLISEISELTHLNRSPPTTFIEPSEIIISNNDAGQFINKPLIFEDIDIVNRDTLRDELNKNTGNIDPRENTLQNYQGISETDSVNYDMESNLLKEKVPYKNIGKNSLKDTAVTENLINQTTDQNNADTKTIEELQFDDESKADKEYNIFISPVGLGKTDNAINPKSDLNLDSKVERIVTESAVEMTSLKTSVPDQHNSNRAQIPRSTSKTNGAPFKINLAIQSYVDDNNQVIIKSFDAEKAPKSLDTDNVSKRFPNDTVRITNQNFNIGDEIKIPIDSDNDLYIQIKSNKQKDISGVDGYNITELNKTTRVGNDYKKALDPMKRNVIIADDIRRTLVAVYEEELLPLRNTISELRDNMEMLTSQHMLLKGHMFIKKPRPARIVPLYRKCACMRR